MEDIHKQANLNESEKKIVELLYSENEIAKQEPDTCDKTREKKTHTFTKMIYHMTKFLSVFFLAPQNRNLNHSIKYKAFFL